MNCVNFESIVDDLVRNQIMEAGAREQALFHSSGCAMCAARLQEEEALTQGLRELSVSVRDEGASVEASDEMEARLAVAFREHHAAASGGGHASSSVVSVGFGRGSRHYWNYAAAAGILLAVALGLVAGLGGNRLWRAGSSREQLAQSNGSGAPANPPKPIASEKIGPEKIVSEKNPASPHPVAEGMLVPEGVEIRAPRHRLSKYGSTSRARLAKSTKYMGNTVTVQSLNIMAPVEVTTEFIPIGYANAANVQEGGQVVRLEMPRYAMARFGVPINEERHAEMVKADVWVGADGLARAIRFVQ